MKIKWRETDAVAPSAGATIRLAVTTNHSTGLDYRLCVAPMMAWTDRHCRYLHRLLAPAARLYTEMLSTDALLHGDACRLLAFDPREHPVAAQLGGNDPTDLARAAKLVESAGFDEVNLNVGCPSERVQKGAIGACLMREPDRVAAGVAAMLDATTAPVTVKCRIGVADSIAEARADGFGALCDFVGRVADAGVRVFIVHARLAILSGLTPAQNRSVPPLRTDLVERLARAFPHLTVVVNGGVRTAESAKTHLAWAAGVMIGRKAYQDPVWLSRLHAELVGGKPLCAEEAFRAYLPYVERQLGEGARLRDMTRHMLTLFNGMRGARAYRRLLSTSQNDSRAGLAELLTAAASVARRDPRQGSGARYSAASSVATRSSNSSRLPSFSAIR